MGILKNWSDKCRSSECTCQFRGRNCLVTEGLICKKCEQASKVKIYYSYTSDKSAFPRQENGQTEICTNCIKLCDNCIGKIKDGKLDSYWDLCKNCDPSDEKIKYEWSCEEWRIMGYHQKCYSCNLKFLSCTRDVEISNCSKCDPSDNKIQYKWINRCQRIGREFDNRSYIGWQGEKYFYKCRSCKSKFVTEFHVNEFYCSECNPSGDGIQYKWRDFDGWFFNKRVNTCSRCKQTFFGDIYDIGTVNCWKCDLSDDKI